ncbi:MAG: zinc-ribbon domain-containing protein [Polyangiales bacterium]
MDVVCDRCKTEYEFDDALVSERGTTVKCTNCSHQFKIFRPPTESEGGRAWTLRRPDGTVIPFDSLAVLQKWILEGRVSKMDEIARSGDGWKPLGAIAELESFFSSADARRTPAGARPVTSRPPGRSLPPLRPGGPSIPAPATPAPGGKIPSLRAPASPSTLRPPAPPSQAILKGTAPMSRTFGGTSPGMAPPTPPTSTADAASPRATNADRTPIPAALSSPGPVEIAAAESPRALPPLERAAPEPPRPPPATPRAAPEALPSSSSEIIDDDAPTRSLGAEDLSLPAPPRRGGLFAGVAVGLVLAGLGAVAAWKMGMLGGATPATPAPSNASVSADLAAIHRTAEAHHRGALEDARDALTRLLGARPRDGAVLAARAQVLALAAELSRDAAEDQERQAEAGAAGAERRALAAVQRADAARTQERATTDFNAALTAVRAMESGPARDDAEVSLLDAARVLGVTAEVTRLLPAVKARASGSSRAALVAALCEPTTDEAVATLRRLAGAGSPGPPLRSHGSSWRAATWPRRGRSSRRSAPTRARPRSGRPSARVSRRPTPAVRRPRRPRPNRPCRLRAWNRRRRPHLRRPPRHHHRPRPSPRRTTRPRARRCRPG